VTISKNLTLRWAVQSVPVRKDTRLKWSTSEVDQPQRNRGFISKMDDALVEKCRGMRVFDRDTGGRTSSSGRSVPVGFRRPQEPSTALSYPYVMVELLNFTPAHYREHRGSKPQLQYVPEGYTAGDWENGDYLTTDEFPIPYDFMWQVTTMTRSFSHDRQVQEALLGNDRFPPRGAFLVVDDTIRYCTVTGPVNGDVDLDSTKRLFRKIYTVTATAELFQRDLKHLVPPTSIVLDVETTVTSA
jgi:hypothetical protein